MKNEVPLFSIVIPLYNREKLVVETLRSVQSQTYTHWECLVVDDGSTDKSFKVAQGFSEVDSRIKVIKRDKEPKGAPACRNIGIKLAQGEYLIFLDSDDLLVPEALARRKVFFEQHNDNDFIVFPAGLFKWEIDDTKKVWNLLNKEEKADLERFFDRDTPWEITAPTWKLSSIRKLEGFDEQLDSGQDWELHVRALIMGLNYTKSPDTLEYIDHFIRRGIEDTTKVYFYDKKRMENRLVMYANILQLLQTQECKVDERYIVKHLIRYAWQAVQEGHNNLVSQPIKILKSFGYITTIQEVLLKWRLQNINLFVNRIIDAILFRAYKLANLLEPINSSLNSKEPFN